MIKTMNMYDIHSDVLANKTAKIASYGISENYVPNWTEVQALTEYVANFYDENNTNFTITETEGGIILEDNSKRGILLKDLVVGNSSSREFSFKIGTHGEGFKLGALVLVRNGKIVIIETIGHTIVFYLEFEKKLNSTILKSKIIPNDRKEGSRIYLETNADILREVKSRFLFLNNKLIKLNDFLYQSDFSDNNQIYVNTLASQKIKSFFSYSLFKKQIVNRDRNMLESPYEDILVELFSIKDKSIIKQWLSCLADSNFRNSFEFELIEYYTKHFRRKALKDLDLTLFSEAAKEIQLQYIGSVKPSHQRAYKLAHPEKHLIVTQYGLLSYFCEKFLAILITDKGLNYGFKVNDEFHMPVFNKSNVNQSTSYEKIVNLYRYLDSSSILKSSILDGCKIIFTLKKDGAKKIDFIKGKTSKNNSNIRSVFTVLHALNEDDNVSFLNFDTMNMESDGVKLLSIKKFPSSFELLVNDVEILDELAKNILFMEPKIILKDIAYELSEGKTFLINSDFHISEEVKACFSYRYGYTSVRDIFESSTIVKKILESVKENPLSEDLYEFTLLSHLISSFSKGYYNKQSLSKVLKEQFLKVFGSKSVVSSSDEGDKKARYNNYHVVKLNSVLTLYFKELKVCLSEQIKGSESIDFDIIEKPTLENISELMTGTYFKVIESVGILQKILLSLYEKVKEIDISDSKGEFLMGILPYFHKFNELSSSGEKVTLNKSNYKKVTKEYCFKVLEKTYLVKNFSESNSGLKSRGSIYVKNSDYSHGIFFHEYVHFATDLIDIDEDFEKTLILVNILAKPYVNIEEKEVQSFFNDYKKWLGV